MPLDDALPPSRLPVRPTADQIASHFVEAYGIRVDVQGLETLPERARLGLAGARPPEPPDAMLIDRVLQVAPRAMLRGVKRIVVLGRGTARYGGYLNGIVRLGASSADRRTRDADFGGRFSVFVTTVLHEIGHSVYLDLLAPEQHTALTDTYLDRFIRERPRGAQEPSEGGAEHFFVALLTAALLRTDSSSGTAHQARSVLELLRVRMD